MDKDRLEVWLDFAKWVFGTFILGLASVVINWKIQQIRIDLDTKKQDHEIAMAKVEQQRVFLESFVSHAMSRDILSRIRLAHYVTRTTTDTEIRSQWTEFYEELKDECERTYKISKSRALDDEAIELELCAVGGANEISQPISTTSTFLQSWENFYCNPNDLNRLTFGPARILVAPPAADAFLALADVMDSHSYEIRSGETASYNCRDLPGSTRRSAHAFGVAIDVNWQSNPFNNHSGQREVRFSSKLNQAGRANDVASGEADTDMTKAMIDDVLKISTLQGRKVFRWGGNYRSMKDVAHFELLLSPEELSVGIDPSSVVSVD